MRILLNIRCRRFERPVQDLRALRYELVATRSFSHGDNSSVPFQLKLPSKNEDGGLNMATQDAVSSERIQKLSHQLSESAEYIPQIMQLKKDLKDQLLKLKNQTSKHWTSISLVWFQIKQIELKKQNSRMNNEYLHEKTHALKQKAVAIRNDTWTAENKVKTLYRELEEATLQRDQKAIEVEKLQVEVKQEKQACKDIAKLKEKIRGELATLKKDRDWYKREVYAQARKAEQLKSRLDNLKAANAHLQY
eukprot:jgi/Bigna1/69419/fgenesh1_pg.9_\